MPPRGHKRPHRQPYGLNYQHQGYTPRDGYADDQAGSRDPSQYQSSFSHTAQPQTYPHASYPGANSSSSSNFTIARGWTVQIPPQAYIQAYEAQLVYPSSSSQPDGPRYGSATRQAEGTAGHGTIRYAGEVKTEGESGGTSGGYGWNTEGEGSGSGQAQEEVWADRHDIIHLLPSLTIRNRYNQRPPASPTGSTRSLSSSSSWDSLPSDVEEKFALSDPEEIEAYEIAKKKKWMETLRAERLKEREKEDRALGVSANGWKDDEEPPAPILATMQHTARAIFSSPNPSVLELRILTNHAKDERFEFLKGRYRSTWERTKKALKEQKDKERKAEEKKRGLGGLMGGYESSGDDQDDEADGDEGEDGNVEEPTDDAPPPPPPDEDDEIHPPPPPPPPEDDAVAPPSESSVVSASSVKATAASVGEDDEEKRRQRRLRAEEWKRARNRDKA